MFFVMVEISNYRQLSRLRASDATDIRGLLEHFCQNRGGRLTREQNGFFLFSFHPLREKVLEQVADFLFLTSESLQKKKDDLFGFSLLLEQDDLVDEGAVFNKLKALIFLAAAENRVWAGPKVLSSLLTLFPVSPGDPLTEILGPPQINALPPLTVDLLLEMTGWIEALKIPLKRQLSEASDATQGKILRLKGPHLSEKFFVLKTVLHQIYGVHDDFPVLFPLEDSRDFLSQLLTRVDLDRIRRGPRPHEPAWHALLTSRGGGDYPGDSGREDVVGALGHYFRLLMDQLSERGLPPVFVFLVSQRYEPEAQSILDTILGELVHSNGLKLLLLETQDRAVEFLGRHPSLSWTFPGLSWDRVLHEREARGWQERFPILRKEDLEACEGRGMAWVHHLWTLQEGAPASEPGLDPSWSLFRRLDASHHKVYFVLWAARGLLEEPHLVEFFQRWGEDSAVIQDKVRSLGAMGFFLGGVPQPLRPDFGPWLTERLGEEGRELLKALGEYLFQKWSVDHTSSEVLFAYLGEWGLPGPSATVLGHYLTNKINQGLGDFLPLLRPRLWEAAPSEEWGERLRLMAAAAKLRFSLNLRPQGGHLPSLDLFRRHFTSKTAQFSDGEWHLQQGRWFLRMGDLATGFALLKKSLLEAQERDDRALEVRAETEIGLVLLRKSRMEEGREYFEIASRLADKTGSSYLITLTSALDAIALFLLGNLTGCLEAIRRGCVSADQGGLRRWRIHLGFLQARLEFDQGDYSAALVTLDRSSALAVRYRVADALPLLEAWKARAEAYSGNCLAAQNRLKTLAPSAERSFFWAEAAYFDKDWAAARVHAAEARSLVLPTQPFGVGETVDWTSGFSGIEDRLLAKPGDLGALANQIEGFQLLLEGLESGGDGVSTRFQALLSRKTLLDLDPASGQFYYWFYLVLPKNDPLHEAQRLTLLGRALKDAQVRASRIEEPTQRQDYLVKPYWNGQFSLEARRLKLL